MSKRTRTMRVTHEERELFKTLVFARLDVVARKSRDVESETAKTMAWHAITKEFNETSGSEIRRTIAQMKKLWQNLKEPHSWSAGKSEENPESPESIKPKIDSKFDSFSNDDDDDFFGDTDDSNSNHRNAQKTEADFGGEELSKEAFTQPSIPAQGSSYPLSLPTPISSNGYKPVLPSPRRRAAVQPGTRTSKFTPAERRKFRSLVGKLQHVIDSRKNDTASLINKNRAWEIITNAMNHGKSGEKRTSASLIKLWHNIKFKERRGYSGGRGRGRGRPPKRKQYEEPSFNSEGDQEFTAVNVKTEPICQIKTEEDEASNAASTVSRAEETEEEHDSSEEEMTEPDNDKQDSNDSGGEDSAEETSSEYQGEEQGDDSATESSHRTSNELEMNGNASRSQLNRHGAHLRHLRQLYKLEKKNHAIELKMLQTRITYEAGKFALEKQILDVKRKVSLTDSEEREQSLELRRKHAATLYELESQLLESKVKHKNLKMENCTALLEMKKNFVEFLRDREKLSDDEMETRNSKKVDDPLTEKDTDKETDSEMKDDYADPLEVEDDDSQESVEKTNENDD